MKEASPLSTTSATICYPTLMTSWVPVGVHFVAGFRTGKLVQLVAIPFHNQIFGGNQGPLDETDLVLFQKALLDRSSSDPNKYYSDPSSLTRLQKRLGRFSFAKIDQLRGRHVLYAAGILFHHYPVIVVGSGLLTVTLAAFSRTMFILLRQRNRRRDLVAEALVLCHCRAVSSKQQNGN